MTSAEAVRRNPILGLPAVAVLQARPEEERQALAQVLLELRAQADAKAEDAWRRRKGPMAAYWRAVSTYAGHIAKAVRNGHSLTTNDCHHGR